jgi:serine/threonine protein kinase
MYLPTSTILNNRYRVEAVIGHGGFGVTYLAQDLTLHVRVAVKEYLPRQVATRGEGQTRVTVFTGEAREHFRYGLNKFLEEARSVARFADHPNVVSTRDYFEANGTAYMVMEYLDGATFKEFLDQKGGRLSFELAKKIMLPVMDALREIHAAGLLHRDISPDNIYLTSSGQVKLLDFGAARYFSGEQSKSLSVILKAGYAPEEQYRSSGKQGAWTDVYATAATIYRAITGVTPPDALDRKEEDTLQPPSHLGADIAPAVEQTLLKALAVNATQRFQNMAQFQEALLTGQVPGSDITEPIRTHSTPPFRQATWVPPASPAVRRKASPNYAAIIAVSLAAVVVVIGGLAWLSRTKPSPQVLREPKAETRVVPQQSLPQTAKSPPGSRGAGSQVNEATLRPLKSEKSNFIDQVSPHPSKIEPQAPVNLSKEALEQGRSLYKQGRFEEAAGKLEEAVRLDSTSAEARYLLGWGYNQVNRYPEAEEQFKQAVELNPGNALAHAGLAWTYNKLGRHSEAITAGEKAVSLQNKFPDAHLNLGMAYLGAGNLKMAMQQYRILQTMDKEKARVLEENLKQTAAYQLSIDQTSYGVDRLPENMGQQTNLPGRERSVARSTDTPRWPWTSSRLVTESDLAPLSKEELMIMRNEITARHGMVFTRKELQEYFQSQSWYRPRGRPDNQGKIFKDVMAELNSVEKKNFELILQYAKKTGKL